MPEALRREGDAPCPPDGLRGTGTADLINRSVLGEILQHRAIERRSVMIRFSRALSVSSRCRALRLVLLQRPTIRPPHPRPRPPADDGNEPRCLPSA